VLGPFWNRLGLYVTKLSMIYHVACGRSWQEPINEEIVWCAARTVIEYLAPAHWLVGDRASSRASGYAAAIERVKEALQNAQGGIKFDTMLNVTKVDPRLRTQVLAALDEYIHYEHWTKVKDAEDGSLKKVTRGGRPYLVVVWGKKPLEANARGEEEGRRLGGERADQPKDVLKILDDSFSQRKWNLDDIEQAPISEEDWEDEYAPRKTKVQA
jgi:hypothetical protein